MREPPVKILSLPSLPDFSYALLESVSVGPRRAVTLTLSLLVWEGQEGHRGPFLTVRLGGIVNFDEVAVFFAEQRLPGEIADLNYAAGYASKPGALSLELVFE